MPQPKEILENLARGPASLENSIPQAPKLSGILTAVAQALPPGPKLPGGSIGANSKMAAARIPKIIKGIEEGLNPPPVPGAPPTGNQSIMSVEVGDMGLKPIVGPPFPDSVQRTSGPAVGSVEMDLPSGGGRGSL
jgi:hypothetical protein